MNNINNTTGLIPFHPYLLKHGSSSSSSSYRIRLLALLSLVTLIFLILSLHTTTRDSTITSPSPSPPAGVSTAAAPMPKTVANALLHYASTSNSTAHMSLDELETIANVLLQCPPPCNFIVFGLSPETLLWRALNHNGRTVFIEENRYHAAYYEEKHPGVEVYDVQYTTRVAEVEEMVKTAKEQVKNECRPVQNLLFSECKLGLNDLPNEVYEVGWDVILVDGPQGYGSDAPGRMSSIFTAGVLARSKKEGETHVFVHDFYGEVEAGCSMEFLCRENMVERKDALGHFMVEKMEKDVFHFCRNETL